MEAVGPLSAAETAKLLWSLPHIDRHATTPALTDQVWRIVGGHPRSLEYLDAVLEQGQARFADITARLTTAVQHRLGTVVVSAASVGTVASPDRPDPPRHNPGDGFLMRHVAAPLAEAAFRRHYVDLALTVDGLRQRPRPDRLPPAPPARRTVAPPLPHRRGPQRARRRLHRRADGVYHMLAVLDRPETFRHDIGIAY